MTPKVHVGDLLREQEQKSLTQKQRASDVLQLLLQLLDLIDDENVWREPGEEAAAVAAQAAKDAQAADVAAKKERERIEALNVGAIVNHA